MSVRKKIIDLVEKHFEEEFPEEKFIPGKTQIPVSGKSFDYKDIESLVEASLDFWLTEGRFTDEFEKKFSEYLKIKHTEFWIFCKSFSFYGLDFTQIKR